MKMQRMLVVIVILQAMMIASFWAGRQPAAANAQIPNPGAQRDQQLDELRQINARLDQLNTLLAGGKLQVQVQRAEEK